MVAAGEGGTAANNQHKVIGARLGWADKRFAVSAATTQTENNLTVSGKFKDHSIGGQADVGVVRLSAAYRVFEQAASDQTNMMIGATVPVGQGEVKLSWIRADLEGRVGATVIDANDAQQWGLGLRLLVQQAQQPVRHGIRASTTRASGTFVVPGGSTLAAGGNSTGVEFGMRHSF
jgi:hypothetical protein